MAFFTVRIKNYGITIFVLRALDGQVFQCFTSLPEELRRRLYSNLPDKLIIELALVQHWCIVELERLTSNETGFPQVFRVVVRVNRRALRQPRIFQRLNNLLELLQKQIATKLLVRLIIMEVNNGKLITTTRHNSGSIAFAKLYLHQFTSGLPGKVSR